MCDNTGFKITVDETCRASHYAWIDWSSTFIDGDGSTVEMPASAGTTCKVVDGARWTYTVAFEECNLAAPVKDGKADDNGVFWHTYSLYLNYDNKIDSANGVGNLQQLDQTLVQCRVPANLQENAVSGTITITDTADLIPNASTDVDLWSKLQLDVVSGGFLATAKYGPVLAADSTIGLGEHVKLQINNVANGTVTNDYK